jgi:hypothetical protein
MPIKLIPTWMQPMEIPSVVAAGLDVVNAMAKRD